MAAPRHENLSDALVAALDAYPSEAEHVGSEVRALADDLDSRRGSDAAVLEDALLKAGSPFPIDRSESAEMAYLRKMSPSAAAALEVNAARP